VAGKTAGPEGGDGALTRWSEGRSRSSKVELCFSRRALSLIWANHFCFSSDVSKRSVRVSFLCKISSRCCPSATNSASVANPTKSPPSPWR